MVGLPRALRPFRSGQYRILMAALVTSMLGAGSWLVALAVQVQALGGTLSDMSLAVSLNAVGLLGAVLIAGVVTDRVPQKAVLVAGESTKVLAFAVAAGLALSGNLDFWQLAVISLVLGVTDGFFYPAYVSLLPSILRADELQPANGIEGTLRPALQQAGGPLLAGGAIALASPAVAFVLVAVLQLLVVGALLALRATPSRRGPDERGRHPIATLVGDLREAVGYLTRTSWLLGVVVYAGFWVFLVMGALEVLLPFAVPAQTGGQPESYSLVLAGYGLGGALGALVVASIRLPRRYLTTLVSFWAVGTVPLALVGVTSSLGVLIGALAVAGFAFAGGQVLWNTLLQRRIPAEILGRVASLDFFVTIALMPLSMAIAGPVAEAIGFGWAFLIAGLVPAVLGGVAIVVFRMRRDEVENPLDDGSPPPSRGIAPWPQESEGRSMEG